MTSSARQRLASFLPAKHRGGPRHALPSEPIPAGAVPHEPETPFDAEDEEAGEAAV